MHIPDGFLNLKTAAATGVLAATGLGLALRQARQSVPARRVPLLGLSAAFVFAAQMLNFPVAGGTSGHLIGGVLTAALLGPSAAVIVISAVLIVQCFLFADGGMTALGANIFNMALVGGVGGWAVYYLLSRAVKGLFGRIFAAVLAAWVSTVVASIACAGELAASGTIQWSVAFPAMAGVHMLIGIGEGAITALVLAAIARSRPELLGLAAPLGMMPAPSGDLSPANAPALPSPAALGTMGKEKVAGLVVLGLVISLGLALFVAPFACSWPDGLDKTAELLGFKDKEAAGRLIAAPVPDYKMPGISSQGLATALAGAAGTIFAFGLAWGLARVLVPKAKAQRQGVLPTRRSINAG
jgi:cobalt/nickel transport system permease protein